MRTSVQERVEREYYEYQRYTHDQLKNDEITMAGEHIGAHKVRNVFFERRSDDFVVINSDGSETSLVATGEAAALHYDEIARIMPEFAWQSARAQLEKHHIQHALSMQPGDIRVVISDCPINELRRHGKNVFGYKMKEQLGFIQLFHVDKKNNLTIYAHSFEQNDADALDAMYALFGRDRDRNGWTLAQPIDDHIGEGDPAELVERIRASYDTSLHKTRGGEWFAGRAADDVRMEANVFVTSQSDLLEAHLEKLIFLGPKSEAANQQRYDFAKAIEARYEGRSHLDTTSAVSEMSSAGSAGRANGETVDFCGITIEVPTDATLAGALDSLGMHMKREWKKGSCRNCLDIHNPAGVVGECNVCLYCETADNNGNNLDDIHKRALRKINSDRAAYIDTPINVTEKPSNRLFDADYIVKQFGEQAIMRTELKIGGTNKLVINKATHEVLAQI